MVTRTAASSLCRSCKRKILSQQNRSISSTSTRSLPPPHAPFSEPKPLPRSESFERLFNKKPAPLDEAQPAPAAQTRPPTTSNLTNILQAANTSTSYTTNTANNPYHLNLYAHKHNTHLTFTSPSFAPILSFSCGQLGLRKAQRGSFDAAYQLCTFMFRKMSMAQWRNGGKKMTANPRLTLANVGTKDNQQNGLEVVLRGYGPGREAFQKALLGQEGIDIRRFIHRVTDGTRLKFGGTRSPAVRRLG